jgi:acyl transferase domain-containing protein
LSIRRKANLRSRFARKLQRRTTEPIAVVGMSCRFPGAPDLNAYRRLLDEGREGRREIPPDRWDVDAFYDPVAGTPGTMATRYGGFIDDIDRFDAGLFRLTPREVDAMDPQHRLLLEVAWEAFESAGMPPRRLAGSQTGVYVGISTFDYLNQVDHRAPDGYTNTGMAHSAGVGRLSFFFDLKGPCEAIDTACSASLVAVHNACQSLRMKEIDCALAGGVNAIVSPYGHVGFSQAGMMSPDGRCKTFDARADGYARSEGCGMVVLKRLSDARRDGDIIHAVITGSAVNHDGRSQGFTAPNGLAQRDLMQRAWNMAGHGPTEIDYVEAHGTGTALGDPQELSALGAALRGREAAERVVVASAKSNLGHLEAAAGIAGLIKLVLMVRDGEVFPHIHLQQTNPNIDLRALPLQIPAERRPWGTREKRVGGVSSFGFSGTNAHVIVESALEGAEADAEDGSQAEASAGDAADAGNPTREGDGAGESAPAAAPLPPLPPRPVDIVPLSARTRTALAALAGRWSRQVREQVSDTVADLAFTASTGRHHFDHRAAVVAGSRRELEAGLRALHLGGEERNLLRADGRAPAQPRVAFLFTGQGAQYPDMGKALYSHEPVFREALDACETGLRTHLPRPLLEVMFAGSGDPTIHETRYAQPALFALEYALCRLWESWGVKPWAVLGHSVGELAAACVAGALSLDDALVLVATRGRLMQNLPQNGTMMSMRCGVAQVREAAAAYGDRVSIAAINGPQSTVVSGEREAVRAVGAALEQAGIQVRELTVSHAFHSALMDPMLDAFEAVARGLSHRPPRCRLISNLTGAAFAEGEVPDARYWRRHVREPVRFEDGMRALAAAGATAFLEIGPQPTLTAMARLFLGDAGGEADTRVWLPSLIQDGDDLRRMQESAAALYVHGVDLDWAGIHARRPVRRVPAPTYPFERKRYWIERSQSSPSDRPRISGGHPLLGQRLPSPLATAQFEAVLGAETPAYLSDHRIYGLPVFPAAGYVELALAAVRAAAGERPCELEHVRIERAMILPEGGQRRVQVLLTPRDGGDGELCFSFEIHSQPMHGESGEAAPWLLHTRGQARCAGEGHPLSPPPHASAPAAFAGIAADDPIDPAGYYRLLADRGMRYTGAFQALTALWRGPHGSGTSFARVALPADNPVRSRGGGGEQTHLAHPAALDACFQAIGVALATKFSAGNAVRMAYLPVEIERVRLRRPIGSEVSSHVQVHLDPRGMEYSADLSVFAADGEPALEVTGLRMQGVERSRLREATSEQQHASDILHRLTEAGPGERWDLMVAFIAEQAADIMGLERGQVDGSLMYFELGMSSLGSVELQYRIQKNLRCELPSNLMVDYESTDTLAAHLLAQVFGPDAFERKDV